MTSIISVSPAELKNRRQQLQRRRRIKFWQGIWRSLLVTGMAGGLVWAVALPNWVIRKPEQIEIEGNQLLSVQAVRSLIPMSYPQSILQLQPSSVSQGLEDQGPIAEATVTRQLLPPSLTVEVKERKPVAIALPTQETDSEIGYLDEQGIWMAKKSYTGIEHDIQLPTLKVIGLNSQSTTYWSEIYQAVARSRIKIFEIDFQDPSNLVFKTELGEVHFGSYNSRIFPEQLSILAQMGNLNTKVEGSKIDYIDLQNPQNPALKMKGNKG
ncbi:MAG: FtsQ-type POTRA domain-containing protein [Spirulinaceae cyanobacterium]